VVPYQVPEVVPLFPRAEPDQRVVQAEVDQVPPRQVGRRKKANRQAPSVAPVGRQANNICDDGVHAHIDALQATVNSLAEIMANTAATVAEMTRSRQPGEPQVALPQPELTQPVQPMDQLQQPPEQQVQNVVDDHIATLLGSPNTLIGENRDFVSVSLPLDMGINDKVKSKIWANEYIDLAIILETESNPSYSLQFVPGEENPSLKIEPA
jgi:hypothetical protein